MDNMTRVYFNQKTRKIPGRSISRDDLWAKLTEPGGGWVKGESTGKQKDVIRPQIQIRRNYHSLFPVAVSDNTMFELPEEREFEPETAEQLKTLISNLGIIMNTIKAVTASDQKKVDTPTPSSPKAPNSPKRRISQKTSCEDPESQQRVKRIRQHQSEASSQHEEENVTEQRKTRLLKRPASSAQLEETQPVLPEQGEEAASKPLVFDAILVMAWHILQSLHHAGSQHLR